MIVNGGVFTFTGLRWSSETVRWRLELDGHEEELRGLGTMFGRAEGLGLRIWYEDGKHWLHAPEFEDIDSAGAVDDRGIVLVGRLNGLVLIKFGSFRPIEAGSLRIGEGGVAVFPGLATFYLPSNNLLAYLDYDPNRPSVLNVARSQSSEAYPRWSGVGCHRRTRPRWMRPCTYSRWPFAPKIRDSSTSFMRWSRTT
jgi:hypothetical protein